MKPRIWLLVAALAFLPLGTAATHAADNAVAATPPPPPPSPAPADLVAKGKSLYMENCQHCHGLNMVNPGTSSFDLRKFPHDEWSRFYHSVTHGKRSMPAWGDVLKTDEIQALFAYIRTGGKS